MPIICTEAMPSALLPMMMPYIDSLLINTNNLHIATGIKISLIKHTKITISTGISWVVCCFAIYCVCLYLL